jgi:hypothetical protein
MEERLERLRGLHAKATEEVDAAKATRKAIADGVEARGETDLTADETVAYRAETAKVKQLQERAAALAEEIGELEEEAVRSGRNDETAARIVAGKGGAEVLSEPSTYGKTDTRKSYLLDLARHSIGQADASVLERLNRHSVEVSRDPAFRKAAQVGPEYRNLDRNEGTGGLKSVATTAA